MESYPLFVQLHPAIAAALQEKSFVNCREISTTIKGNLSHFLMPLFILIPEVLAFI